MNLKLSYDEFLQAIKDDIIPAEAPFARENCPIESVFNMLQGKWKNHVLFELCRHETVRFGEIKKGVPEISNTMLTTTLRELEECGLINRLQFNEIPPHVEYSMTAKGRELMPIYYQMFLWGLKYNF